MRRIPILTRIAEYVKHVKTAKAIRTAKVKAYKPDA